MALLEYAAVFLCGCIFMLLASSWSSPLFKDSYGYDSSWYSTVGRAILAGYVPYRDLFDLKGPAFFFYQAFGQLFLKGRNGVFLLQCLSGGTSAVLLYRTGRLYLSRSLSWVVLLIFYFPYFYLLWGGNTTEELFMPLNIAAIWMGLRFLGEGDLPEDRSSMRTCACLFGLFSGVFIYSKITSGAPLYAVMLYVTIRLLLKKKFRELLECALYYLLGIVLISIPIFMFFGLRGALKDMIHCVFVLGLKRSTDYYISFSLEWERNLMICPVSLLLALLLGKYAKEGRLKVLKELILISALVIYILLHLGSAYTYYFITLLPLWGLDLILCLCVFTGDFKALAGSKKGLAKFIFSCLLLLLVMAFYFKPVRHKVIENAELVIYGTDFDYVRAAKETFELVPEWERAGIYNIESGFKFYEINKILPNNKYSVNIPYFLHLDDNARVEFMNLLIKRYPKWIVTENLDIIDIPEFQEYIFRNYTIVAENDYGYLYRRNG